VPQFGAAARRVTYPIGGSTVPAVSSALVTRRPVFDRELDVAAYELLVAEGDEDETDLHDASDSVSRLVLEVAGDARMESILGGQRPWLSLPAPAAQQVVEANLRQQPATIELARDGAGDLRSTVAGLQGLGHTVAMQLDPTADQRTGDILQGAEIAAIDVTAMSPDEMTSVVQRVKAEGASAAATNVEAPEQREAAHDAGFDLFRGEFFKRPHSREGGGIAPSRLAVLRLLGALQDPDLELPQLATLLSQDVTLTYRLLRYINSAFFGTRREVTSISHALALLGLRNVKRWASVIMLAEVDHRPRELLTTALVRARFCERLGPHFRQTNVDQLFALGLFSVLDALMDTPMSKALRPLPLTEQMVGALTLRSGAQGDVLACVLAAERGERCKGFPADEESLAELYRECLEWGTESSKEL
jgi:EAL and modified HD-GYP domain-containing signal transduction protein